MNGESVSTLIKRILVLSLLLSATNSIARVAEFRSGFQDAAGAKQAEVPSTKRRLLQEVQLTGDASWLDSGIDVKPGERLVFSSTGKLRYADAQADNTPNGVVRGFKDLLRALPYNSAGRGAVIGRIGDKATAQPFLIGEKKDVVAATAGRLSIGINQTGSDVGDGNYTVRVEVYEPDPNTVLFTAKAVDSLPGVDNSLFAKIPRRITDKAGNAGDMVNFVALGSKAAMEKTFTTAGWVKVDADVKDTILNGFLASMSKESYLTMPMSPLYLFGRAQDYGWAHAEPISVVSSRNHLRLWKADFTVNGQTVWVGAATHDIGFEKDQRNNGLAHKIDPNIDLERDYVEKTLSNTGFVAEVTHFLPEDAMQTAKTATGGSFHSDGRVLIVKLGEAAKKP